MSMCKWLRNTHNGKIQVIGHDKLPNSMGSLVITGASIKVTGTFLYATVLHTPFMHLDQ